MAGWVPFVVVALLTGWIVARYNRLAGLRSQALDRWRQIDVQLERRHDLIPNLVNVARSSMAVERQTLNAVLDARSNALTATGPTDAAYKEQQLSRALARLLSVADNYPALASNDDMRTLRAELVRTETDIGVARPAYNDIATTFNRTQQAFPAHLFAAACGFTPAELFEIGDSKDGGAARVDSSRG